MRNGSMDQTKKPYVCLTATLGSERLAATLACPDPTSRQRLIPDFNRDAEPEIIELLMLGCAHNFQSRHAGGPRLVSGL